LALKSVTSILRLYAARELSWSRYQNFGVGLEGQILISASIHTPQFWS